MAANSLRSALDLLKTQWLTLTNAPGDGTLQEVFGGQMPLAEEGSYLFSFAETYTYATRPPVDPTGSSAELTIGAQFKKRSLDVIVNNNPVSALSQFTGEVRTMIEARSADNTWRNEEPGMEVKFLRSQLAFAESIDLGVVEIVMEIGGFDE